MRRVRPVETGNLAGEFDLHPLGVRRIVNQSPDAGRQRRAVVKPDTDSCEPLGSVTTTTSRTEDHGTCTCSSLLPLGLSVMPREATRRRVQTAGTSHANDAMTPTTKMTTMNRGGSETTNPPVRNETATTGFTIILGETRRTM